MARVEMKHTKVQEVRPPSAAELGTAATVTSANWIDPPYNRHGFLHVRDLTNTVVVAKGAGAPLALTDARIDPSELGDLEQVIHGTYTDSCVVLHRGRLVYEYYDVGVQPTDRHILMSVSKSLTATLIGCLVDEGLLTVDQDVTDFVPELSEWRGCTVQHLLDMRAGIAFDEHDMDDLDAPGVLIEQVSGYTTRRRDDIPFDTESWIRQLPAVAPHGTHFEYRSILTSMLGWIAEIVTGQRFAEAFSERIWSKIGADSDADLIVDSKGFPVVEGGFCTTTRDLARFGQMILQRGEIDGRRVVSGEWIDRTLDADPVLVDDYRRSYSADARFPDAYYHDCWWVHDAANRHYTGVGLGGQLLWIDRRAEMVVAKFSSTPKRVDPRLVGHAQMGLVRLGQLLAAR